MSGRPKTPAARSSSYCFSMTARVFMVVTFLSISGLSGCTITQGIPYTLSLRLRLAESSAEKLHQQLTVHMTEELAYLVVTSKPVNIPGTIAYTFPVGESVRVNLKNTLASLFGTVDVSIMPIERLKGKETVLDVELKTYDFHIAPSILGTHRAHLALQYSLYNERGNMLFTILTDTSGTSEMTSGEMWSRVVIPGEAFVSSGWRSSIGRAYDEALAKSIDELVPNLKRAWRP